MATMAAVDLGAQSGRVAVGRFDGERLTVGEAHRFPNVPVRTSGTLQWDVLRLYEGTLEGLRATAREGGAIVVDSQSPDGKRLIRQAYFVILGGPTATGYVLSVSIQASDGVER